VRALTVRVDRIASWFVVGLVMVAAVHGTATLRGLYADGAYYFWSMLQNQGFFLFDAARVFTQYVTQLPAALGIAAGVDDVGVLALLQSAGVVGLPTLVWAAALALLVGHRLFWPMVAIFAVVFLNSGFVAIGEYTVLYALVALTVALMVRDRFGIGSAVALLAAALLMLRSYEAAFYLAPLLAVVAIVRWRQLRADPVARRASAALPISAGIFASAAVLGGLSILYPRDPANRQGAADLFSPILTNRELVISGAIATLYLVARLVLRGRAFTIASLVLAGLSLCLLIPSVWAQPWMQYHARTLTGLALLALLVLALVELRRQPRVESGAAVGWLVPLALAVVQLVPFTVHTQGYRDWLSTFQQELDSRSGDVAMEDTELLPGSATYAWPWTNPFLSVVLRDMTSDTIILSPGADPSTTEAPPGLPARFTR
jgi:hypothetical protein